MIKEVSNFKFVMIGGKMNLCEYLGGEEIVVVPETHDGKPVEVIGMKAFLNSSYTLKKIVLPDTIKEIHYAAFRYCRNLESINLPKNIEVISESAFYACNSLKSIVLPENLKSIKSNTFNYCQNFESITFNKNLEQIENRAFEDCVALEEIHLHENIKSIGAYTFANCENLKKIKIDNPKVKVGKNAFSDLENLEEFGFPVFKGFELEKQVAYLEECIKDWENHIHKKEMFAYLKSKSTFRKHIFLSNNAFAINFLLQQNFKITLTDINNYLENSTKNRQTSINAMYLEYKNNNFTRDEIDELDEENELVEIGLEYPTLKQLKEKWVCSKVDGGLRISGYKGSNETEIIPKQIKDGTPIIAIRGNKENAYKGIRKLNIEAEITEIGKDAFYRCGMLGEVNIPKTVTRIDKSAFAHCGITSIDLPDGLKYIGWGAFEYCNKLEKIVIPDSVTSLGTRLEEKKKLLGNSVEDLIGKSELVEVKLDKNQLKEFKALEVNEMCIFANCRNLKEVVFPKHSTVIPHCMFINCVSLETVVLPDKLELIESMAFKDCFSLKKVKLPETVKIIEYAAFASCSSLEEINLPRSVTNIEHISFYQCSSLKKIEIPKTTEVEDSTFNECDAEIVYI